MKILVPFIDYDGRPLDSPIISGGIERFVKDLVECVPGVHAFPIEKGMSPKKMQELVVGMVNANRPDIVLCNYPQGSLNTLLRPQIDVPIAWVVHHTAGFMSSLGAIPKMAQFSREMGSLFFVSPHQEKRWRLLGERIGAGELITSGYFTPSVIREKKKPIPLADCEWDCSTVGRCEKKPDKDPFLLHYRLRDTQYHTLVMSNPKDNPYYHENVDWHMRKPGLATTKWSLPHDEVMANIAKSKSFMVTWPDETFGITALEALSCGVPVVCNAKMDTELRRWSHASERIPVKPEHLKCVTTTKLDTTVNAVRDFLKMGDDFRAEIADLTYDKFCVDSWRQEIYSLLSQAIDADKKRSRGASVMELFA